MRSHSFIYEAIDPTDSDLVDVAKWMRVEPGKLKIDIKYESIDKFIPQIKEMYESFSEFPKDATRTKKIAKLLKEGATPLPLYVEKKDATMFVMEGRHRMVAFWLAGVENVPVAYVSASINENRIGTALWKSSVPPKYKQFKVIGQGATSVVLDKGDGNVLMLTRDDVKKDWLVQDWGLGLGEWIDTFEASHQQSRAISEMPVYVIQLPKLHPLSAENKKSIKKSIKDYETVVGYGPEDRRYAKFNDYLERHPDGLFAQLLEFLGNYDVRQYGIDFLMRNFMQDQTGAIVLIDPIASKEVTTALHALHTWS